MAALDFPSSPTVGQQYAAPNGVTYQWDGAAWVVTGGPPGQLWTGAGAALTPTDATKRVAILGPTTTVDQSQLVLGPGTTKGRLMALGSQSWAGLSVNDWYDGSAWHQDDPTLPSWHVIPYGTGDSFIVERRPASNGTSATPFQVKGSDGKTYCTLADASVTGNMIVPNGVFHQYGAAGAPNSFSSNAAAWTTVVNVVIQVRATGCVVLLMSSVGLMYVGNNTATPLYVAWFRDGTLLNSASWNSGASGTGLTTMPLPPIWGYDVNATPGAHTYAYSVFVGATNGAAQTRPDNPGIISAWSFK